MSVSCDLLYLPTGSRHTHTHNFGQSESLCEFVKNVFVCIEFHNEIRKQQI